jgi:glutathione S-transferase
MPGPTGIREGRAMIMIRHIEGRRSERVAWLLEELGVPYELDYLAGDVPGSLFALEQHHEMRMTPIVEDGPVVMVESSAILEYLLSKYGKGSSLRPAEDAPEFPAYLEFLHFAEGTAMSKITADGLSRALERIRSKQEGYQAPPKMPGLAGSRTGAQRILHYCENTLAKRPYFAGQSFTAADIMMHFPLKLGAPAAANARANIAQIQTLDGEYWNEFPHVKAFMARMAERPAFQRAMKATMPNGPPAM